MTVAAWKGWGFCHACNESTAGADYCSSWCAEADYERAHKAPAAEDALALPPRLAALVAKVTISPARPNSLVGTPKVLAAICASLGFKNDCRAGHVYLTTAKMRRLGLIDRR